MLFLCIPLSYTLSLQHLDIVVKLSLKLNFQDTKFKVKGDMTMITDSHRLSIRLRPHHSAQYAQRDRSHSGEGGVLWIQN